MNRPVELIEEALGSRQILRGVYRHSLVQDRDHLYSVAVFDEAQHLHSFRPLQGPLLQLAEVLLRPPGAQPPTRSICEEHHRSDHRRQYRHQEPHRPDLPSCWHPFDAPTRRQS